MERRSGFAGLDELGDGSRGALWLSGNLCAVLGQCEDVEIAVEDMRILSKVWTRLHRPRESSAMTRRDVLAQKGTP